jgi:hypothetical protein
VLPSGYRPLRTRRLRFISRAPRRAQELAPEVKLTFLRDLLAIGEEAPALVDALTVTIPLFVNKDPRNPAS